ncbi:MAG: alpha/beta hydrolase-fold protein [Bacteroidales bacterium]|nr:alpha/beta hydrolase-fold protein [Bacteroidales bacterium]
MGKYLLSILAFLFLLTVSTAQVTIKITDVPRYYTPLQDTIFLSGNINNWSPNSPAYIMQRQSDGTYQINISGTAGDSVKFKFTRGSWDNVETQLNGNYLADRIFTYVAGQTINCQVENWEDMLGWHTSTGHTFILDLDFQIPQLNRLRRIWIYFPQDYFTTNNYYPVVYMHDGQNLFDAVYAPFGEWDVDSTMEALFSQFSPSAIIVGIDNGGTDRINEYSPWVNTTYGGGQGDAYIDFIVYTLKPFIDSNFRTFPQRNYTAIMGSSMGGLIGLYGALKYPAVFSKAGIFSPSLWFSDSLQTYLTNIVHSHPMRLYFVAGQNESSSMVTDIQNAMTLLTNNGFSNSEMNLVVKSDGQHSEWFWKREFADAYTWLFQVLTANEELDKETAFFYDFENKNLILSNCNSPITQIYDITGKKVIESSQHFLNLSFLEKGFYIVSVRDTYYTMTKKIYIY